MCSFLSSRENFFKRNLVSWKGCGNIGVTLPFPTCHGSPFFFSRQEPSGLGGPAADHVQCVWSEFLGLCWPSHVLPKSWPSAPKLRVKG